jgi:hypothetical protein
VRTSWPGGQPVRALGSLAQSLGGPWSDRASAAGRANQPAAGAPDPVSPVEGGDGEDATAVVVAHRGLSPERCGCRCCINFLLNGHAATLGHEQ